MDKSANALLHGTLDVLVLKTLRRVPGTAMPLPAGSKKLPARRSTSKTARSIPRSIAWRSAGGSRPSGDASELGRRVKTYRLTATGRARLRRETETWEVFARTVSRASCSPLRRAESSVMRRLLLRSWLWRPSVDDEVDDELVVPPRDAAARVPGEGLTPDQARRAVEARFGDLPQARAMCRQLGKERDRAMLRREYVAEVRSGRRFALRQLRQEPGVCRRRGADPGTRHRRHRGHFQRRQRRGPAPVAGCASRIGLCISSSPGATSGAAASSVGNFTEWSRRSDGFDGLAAIQWSSFNVTDGDTPQRVVGARVTGRYFDDARRGRRRSAGPSDEATTAPDTTDVVVLSHRLWTRSLRWRSRNRRPRRAAERPLHAVVGVMPASFDLDGRQRRAVGAGRLHRRRSSADFDEHFLMVVARSEAGRDAGAGARTA